jgi:hypothetical protein
MKKNNLIGKRFGRLVVIELAEPKSKRYGLFWVCRCDCGKLHTVRGSHLLNNSIKSCGCYSGEFHRQRILTESKKKTQGLPAFIDWLNSYKRGAHRRNLIFSLSDAEFKVLIESPCYYCGALPVERYKNRGTGSLFCNGIDRKDSQIGYTLDNCVSCCSICNISKMDLNSEEFIELAHKISNIHPRQGESYDIRQRTL